MEYQKGKYNIVPDALSQAPHDTTTSTGHITVDGASLMSIQVLGEKDLPISDEMVWRAQQDDPECRRLYQTVMEKGEVAVTDFEKCTVLEGKVHRVLNLPHKTV